MSETRQTTAQQPADSTTPANKRTLRRKFGPIWRALKPFCLKHRALFWQGISFALLLVAVRVALPWPLRQLMTPWLQGESSSSLPESALTIGALYAVLIILLGLADFRLRLCFARFAISVVRDLRERVLNGLRFIRQHDQERSTGDLVTRLVGDSARLKAGLKGLLVHVATNGLMFFGISAVMLWIDLGVGLIFLTASILTVAITLVGASRIFRLAAKQRRKETKLAESISARATLLEEDDEEYETVNQASGTYEARITKLQGLVTWAAHGVLALALPLALWLGFRGVVNETLSPADLFLVMLYALMIIGPMVRLTRQGARSGKILANANRLRALLKRAEKGQSQDDESWSIGDDGITLKKVHLLAPDSETRLFGPLSFHLAKGERLALLGPPGTGTATLLQLLSGQEDYLGKIRSAGREWRKQNPDQLARTVTHNHPDSVPPTLPINELQLDQSWVRKTFRLTGHELLLKRLRKSPHDSLTLSHFSPSEQQFLALLKSLLSPSFLTLLEQPLANTPNKLAAKALLKIILASRDDNETLIASLRKPLALSRFDRILVLRKGGKIAFLGNYPAWKNWKHSQQTQSPQSS